MPSTTASQTQHPATPQQPEVLLSCHTFRQPSRLLKNTERGLPHLSCHGMQRCLSFAQCGSQLGARAQVSMAQMRAQLSALK